MSAMNEWMNLLMMPEQLLRKEVMDLPLCFMKVQFELYKIILPVTLVHTVIDRSLCGLLQSFGV